MSSAGSQRLLQHIRRLAGDPQTAASDGELLCRYREGGDQAAFALLMNRHGPMVYAVCQSVLRQSHDAEDAFQAAFLILTQQAGSIRRQDELGGWLQRIAYHVALKARADKARRHKREAKAARSPVANPECDDLSWCEMRSILHAELAALPEQLRAPMVLCHLEGLTQEEAALRLGWTAATVKGRLQRGREKLRRRLERRGVGLAAALGAVLTGQTLAETAVRALRPFTVETATTTATVLSHGFGQTLAWMKWKVLAVVLLSVGLAVGGAGMMRSPKPADVGPATASTDKPPGERPAPKTDLYGDPLPEGAIARMGSIRLRHAGLSDLLILPDGKTILTTGGRVVRFWNLATGKQVHQVQLQGAISPSGWLSPDGKIVVGIDQNKVILWDIDSGGQIKTLPLPKGHWVYPYFSPDSKTLVLQSGDPVMNGSWKIIAWDWQKGSKREIPLDRSWGMAGNEHSCLSPDGKMLAVTGCIGGLCLYDFATGRKLRTLRCPAITSTFSLDGKRLLVSSKNDANKVVIRLFDPANGNELAQYPLAHEDTFYFLRLSPDGKTLACGESGRGCLLDATTGRVLHELPDRTLRMVFTPDGKTLIANMGHRLRLFDVAGAKLLRDRPGDFAWRPATAISPNGRLLAASDWTYQSVGFWDMTNGRLLRTLPMKGNNKYVRNIAFSTDGKTLVVGHNKGLLQFWDVAGGTEQRSVQLRIPAEWNPGSVYFSQFDVSPDGKHVSTLEQPRKEPEITRLAVWETTTGRLVSRHSLPAQSPDEPADLLLEVGTWSSEGTMATLPLKDGLNHIHVASGVVRFRLPSMSNVKALAASPDGRLLAAVQRAQAKQKIAVGIWETATGKEVATVATGPLSGLALTPDNRHLVAADHGFLRVWDLATGKEQRRWPLPDAEVSPVYYPVVTRLLLSPDGRRAMTTLNDGTALVWDLRPALHPGKPLVENPSDKELFGWWTDLLADDARRAYAALWRLIETPETTIPFLRQHLKPATNADLQEIRRHIADLDSDTFATREKASEQLAKLGSLAEPVLRQALENKPTLEARRRMQLLLDKIDRQPVADEALRLLRVLQVLEGAGAEGSRLLRELAGGAEGAALTREAQSALTRLNRRAP